MPKWLRTGLCWLWIVPLVIFIDRASKLWVMQHLMFFEPMPVLPIFDLTLAYNTGAAFSFLHNASGWQNIFFCGLAAGVSVFVVLWLAKLSVRERWLGIALCLILSGALGNAWDRLQYGFVVDFLSFHLNSWHFAIFNIADSAICIGAFMLFLQWALARSK